MQCLAVLSKPSGGERGMHRFRPADFDLLGRQPLPTYSSSDRHTPIRRFSMPFRRRGVTYCSQCTACSSLLTEFLMLNLSVRARSFTAAQINRCRDDYLMSSSRGKTVRYDWTCMLRHPDGAYTCTPTPELGGTKAPATIQRLRGV
jgi:hypothetical protein